MFKCSICGTNTHKSKIHREKTTNFFSTYTTRKLMNVSDKMQNNVLYLLHIQIGTKTGTRKRVSCKEKVMFF